ncbi:MobF family relaxase, partial [Xanthomonas albilineans]
QDPQLHTHAVVMNLTRRGDGQWRALRNDKIIKSVSYLGAHYRGELAIRLRELGYELRHGRDGTFELAHMRREQLEAFSKRSADIEAALAAVGKDRESASRAEKQAATMRTRPKKGHAERAALYQAWHATAAQAGIRFEKREAVQKVPEHGTGEEGPQNDARALQEVVHSKAADKAVSYAVNHLTERQAIVNESKLIDTAMKHGMGTVTVPAVRAAVRRLTQRGGLIAEAPLYRSADDLRGSKALTREGWVKQLAESEAGANAGRQVDGAIAEGRLIVAEARYTTNAALVRERSILNMERDGRGAVAPIMGKAEAIEKLAHTPLNDKQRNAAAEIVSGQNRVIGVQGLAGTGKTAMLAKARDLAENAGYRMLAVAPYGMQMKALQHEGFEAKTAMALVRAAEKGMDDKTLLVVDEAGVMPARLTERILRMAQNAGARVVLVGDTGQTKAIEAGKPFDQLQQAGMHTVQLDEIIRQRDPELRSAVVDAAHGRSESALSKIKNVIEVRDAQARWQRIVADYMDMPAEQREQTLIVSSTNEARQAINRLIREAEHRVGNGIEFDTLNRRDTTQEERRHSKNYQVGDVIQPERDYPRFGLERGHTYRVMENGPENKLTVADKDGKTLAFSPMIANRLSVYAPERKELAPGDCVRITRNDAALDVANGDRFTVKKVTPTHILLEDNDREVSLATDQPLHVDYGHANTVHSAQGLTSNGVLYDAGTHNATTSKEVFYVAISRVRERVAIYTDDLNALPRAVARPTIKHAALELARDRQRGGHQHEMQAPAAEHIAERRQREAGWD